MKKILLCVPLLTIFAAGFFGCSQQRQWNHEQRKAMREALRSYRQMVYLDDLNDAEFVLFSDEVAGQLENSYPVYMEFVQTTATVTATVAATESVRLRRRPKTAPGLRRLRWRITTTHRAAAKATAERATAGVTAAAATAIATAAEIRRRAGLRRRRIRPADTSR